MTRKRPAKSPEYAVSDEAAAYIADALMELALQFEGDPLRSNTPPRQNAAPPRSNSTCSANIPLQTAASECFENLISGLSFPSLVRSAP
jgi:hypothetical protein